jgi:hypothetical protein
MMNSGKALRAEKNVIDNPVQGPVSLASGANSTYLVYQLASGDIFVTNSNGSVEFPPRQSQIFPQGRPAAAPASGPAIAFDPVGQQVIVAYLSSDGSGIMVVSSDPQLTGWVNVNVIPLNGNPVLPGLAMISGSFQGTSLTVLYAAAASGKIIWASSSQNWSGGFQSVTSNGQPLNLPSASGVSANLMPGTTQIALGFAVPNQSQAFLLTNAANSVAEFPSGDTIPVTTRLTPAVTIEPDDGAWNVFVNAGQTIYYITHYNGQWQPPQPLDDLSMSMAGPPGAAWNGFVLYVACADLGRNLDYDVIALGESKSGARKPGGSGAGKKVRPYYPVKALVPAAA